MFDFTKKFKVLLRCLPWLSADYVMSSKNTTVSSGTTYYKSGTLTLPKKGVYLVLNGVDATVSAPASYLLAAVTDSANYGASNVNVIISSAGFSTMANGGAVSGWALVEALADNAVIVSLSYKYYSGSYTHRNKLLAIRLPELSGGYSVIWFGGGVYAKLAKMLDGYRQFCKKHQDYDFGEAEQEMDKDRRKLGNHILRCEQVQRITVNNGIWRSVHQDADSCGDIIDQCESAVCWNVQFFRNLRKCEYNIRCGIKTAKRIYGDIAALRQIVPRGCCHD